ncbi:hemolysin family protein [Frankia sp. AiPs1]|uniref:hemolysin family protein n=1 Tax=Frankia sp. AiPs1 TaxID=573493 RepID=UPI0020430904|nr:hemolysin family protein [Frankia sp. AiPs1]MCM3924876.1 hemolysin family protein [Frankia sp. AiPs1]
MIQAIVYLAIVVVLIAANALFVAAEFALVAVEPHQAEQAARGGDRRSQALLAAVRSLSFQLSGAQLGITVTSLAVGYLAEPALAALVHPALHAVGLPDTPSSVLALVLALFVATVSQMVFGELVPKNWAISEPLRVGRAVSWPQVGFSRVCGPLIRLLNGVANAVLRALGVEPQDEMHAGRSPAELGSIVRASARQGTLPTMTAALLRRSLRFGDRHAADVMTPRVRTVWADADMHVADLLQVAQQSGHSRFPVRGRPERDRADGDEAGGDRASGDQASGDQASGDQASGDQASGDRASGDRAGAGRAEEERADGDRAGDVDGVVGVVHVKDVFRVPAPRRAAVSVREIMVPPLLVPASLGCDALLSRLRRHGLQLAAVIDEYGGTAGIVTLEDLVEELVGEVSDEHDLPSTPGVVPDGPRSWLLSGLLRPDEAVDATGVRLPDGPYETVAGLVLARLGHLGAVGEQVEVDGVTLTVMAVDRHRIDRVRLSASPLPAPEARQARQTRPARQTPGTRHAQQARQTRAESGK